MVTRRARGRHRGRWVGRGVVAVAAAACPLIAAACAGSAGGVSRTDASHGTLVASREELILFPNLGAGEGGWCLTTVKAGGCQTFRLPVFQGPIVIEHWSGRQSFTSNGKSSSSRAVKEAIVLTTSEVAAVSLEGRAPIETHAESVLPDQLRAVVVELRGESRRRERGLFGEMVPAPLPFPRSHFTALSSKGEPIPQTRAPGPPLEFHVPSRRWGRSQPAPQGACGVMVGGFAGLTFEGGGVMTAVRPHTDVRGQEFVDCVKTTYMLGNWPLEADVLLDAAHPGSTPAPLPAMRPLAGHPGVFQGPGVEGETVARRIPGAWLLVAKGRGLEQRLTLLEHLRVTMYL
jgi:hypothetical protein